MSRNLFPEPGPVINGRPTTIHLLNTKDLASSPLLSGYASVINAAFSKCHPPYIPASFIRILKPDQILEELGPGSFSYIVTQKDGDFETVIASGSATPAPEHDSSEVSYSDDVAQTTVKRSAKARIPRAGYADWELKHVCVDPESMRQGLAGHILGLLDREILARVTARRDRATNDGGETRQTIDGFKLMITTIKELNGLWYQRRDYKMVEFSSYPAGTLGGTEPFSIWHMDRLISL